MRSVKNNSSFGSDLFFLMAAVALMTVVYLCGLPDTFHSLSISKANAASLMGQATERLAGGA